jgi:hypothetical protein
MFIVLLGLGMAADFLIMWYLQCGATGQAPELPTDPPSHQVEYYK